MFGELSHVKIMIRDLLRFSGRFSSAIRVHGYLRLTVSDFLLISGFSVRDVKKRI